MAWAMHDPVSPLLRRIIHTAARPRTSGLLDWREKYLTPLVGNLPRTRKILFLFTFSITSTWYTACVSGYATLYCRPVM